MKTFEERTRRTESGCIEWTGAIDVRGYGMIYLSGGRNCYAHRFAWERERGRIAHPLTVDHLCRNRRCVNVAHLEIVSNRENILRGESPAAKNARKTHCKRGHPLSGPDADVQLKPDKSRGKPYISRRCRACRRKPKRKAAA